VLGALSALNKAGDSPFDGQDEQRFSEFASSMAVILETWQQLQRLRAGARARLES